MPILGFDGRVHRRAPSTGKWLAATFIFSFLYWLACIFWLSADLFVQMLIPDAQIVYTESKERVFLIFALRIIPVIMSFGMAAWFRVIDKDIEAWLILLVGATLFSGFGMFVAIFLSTFFA